jgi:hypothetical protein
MCHTGGLLSRTSMVDQLEAHGLEARFWTAKPKCRNLRVEGTDKAVEERSGGGKY